ncbi:ATP synthase subunit s, mitochondrial [Achroia grisella]|uniref:ATP synthase subunit s, mitochondrial n=1 Tax=Achroia grisella TaxID=688607 RepID=UPI0027D2F058|nr:ATP synthase subunit s, mitochondrial [Achroia grisella]
MSLLANKFHNAFLHKTYIPSTNQNRTFWEYVNMMFNRPDPKRIEAVGPDRACAEWVLRNGGQIIWTDGKKLSDYNSLPADDQKVPKILEIDGTNSSISHYGFPHLSGCTMLQRIILHNNNYIDDRAMKGLSHGRASLTHVQVSKCRSVTDLGIKEIKVLHKLETLKLFDLEEVKNLEECIKYLQSHLPKCQIQC